MVDAQISQIRRFNRIVTQRIGALDDRYLSRDRPLGEARLLWEIGTGVDIRALRRRLGLDAGYVSRLLGSLERAGLVRIAPNPDDRRVRIARLTARGAAERRTLDRRSDELAATILASLGDGQRARMVAAMAEVERLLVAASVEIAVADPDSREVHDCWHAYFREIDQRFETGYDRTRALAVDPDALRPPAGVVLVARIDDKAIGCGSVLLHGREPADLRRMWVAGSARGLGVGRRLLGELERYATAAGARAVRLETNRTLVEAIAMYRSSGYVEVPAFNGEPHAHHWFAKKLPRRRVR
jgi:DNA-binding MarR family transcriptional regulator